MKPSQSSLKKLFVIIILILSLLGSWYLAQNIQWDILSNLSIVQLGMLFGIACLYLIVYTFSVGVILYGMGYPSSAGRLWLTVTSSLSSNYLTPVKAGIPVRVWLYKAVLDVPVAVSSASVALETALGLWIGTILAIVGVKYVFPEVMLGSGVWLLLALLIVFTGSLLLNPSLFSNVVLRYLPSRYSDRLDQYMQRFWWCLKNVPLWTLLITIGLYLARLVIRAFCLYTVLVSLKFDTSLPLLMFAQAISGVVGIISLMPTGLGAKDISLVLLLTQLGVMRDEAVVATVIDRILWSVIPFAIGLLSANVLSFMGIATLSQITEVNQSRRGNL